VLQDLRSESIFDIIRVGNMLYLFVFSQFRTENRYAIFLELL